MHGLIGILDGKMYNEIFADGVRVFLVGQEFLKEAKQLLDVQEELWKMQNLLLKEGKLFSDIPELLLDIPEQFGNVQKLFWNIQKLIQKEGKLFVNVQEEVLDVQKLFGNIRNLFLKRGKAVPGSSRTASEGTKAVQEGTETACGHPKAASESLWRDIF